MKRIIFAILFAVNCSAVNGVIGQNGKSSDTLLPLVDTLTEIVHINVPTTAINSNFWVGVQNNNLAVGNLATGYIKSISLPGSPTIYTTALNWNCGSAYVSTTGGVYKLDLNSGSYTYVPASMVGITSSPDNRYFVYSMNNTIYMFDTATDTSVALYTYSSLVTYPRWINPGNMQISLNDGLNSWHIYTVTIGTWNDTTRVTKSNYLATESDVIKDASGVYVVRGSTIGQTTPSYQTGYATSDLSTFSQIANYASSFTRDINGNVYFSDGPPSGDTQYEMINGGPVQIIPYTNGNVQIMDFCKAYPPVLK